MKVVKAARMERQSEGEKYLYTQQVFLELSGARNRLLTIRIKETGTRIARN